LGIGQKVDDADILEEIDRLGDEYVDDTSVVTRSTAAAAKSSISMMRFAGMAHGVLGQAVADRMQVRCFVCGHGGGFTFEQSSRIKPDPAGSGLCVS
jgi:hypothetical protein